MRQILIFGLLLFLFTGCTEEKAEQMESLSPSGNVAVRISASRVTLDPWKTTIFAEGYGNKESVSTEIYSDAIDKETVQFNWLNESMVRISFNQTDGTSRKILVQVEPSGILIKEQ